MDFKAVSESLGDGVQVVSVRGEVDLATGPGLERALFGPPAEGAGSVIVDLTDCGFLGSTGLHLLTRTQGRCDRSGRRLAVVSPNRSVLRIFAITGLERRFAIYPSRAAALNGMAITSWRERESEKQVRARNANESTARTVAAIPAGQSVDSFVCECGDRGCTCAISLTLAEYASVRAYATHFAIAPDHENPESEQVIAEGERFAVIETISPDATKLARRSDPRWGP